MAKRKTRNAEFLTEWEQLIATLTVHAAEIPHLETSRIKLQGFLDDARSLMQEQDQHDAAKQAASQKFEATMENGKKLATFLRTGIKEHFGNRSVKLVQFGLQPFRRSPAEETETPSPGSEPPVPDTPPAE
ncbi:MAG TPA: hypothetical protein VGX68_15225 [Thermoanaerobaculia bacterium]|jgi:hypothetical protein|nr:hypothetical protein [Thermoanaerobaculia bacterium]